MKKSIIAFVLFAAITAVFLVFPVAAENEITVMINGVQAEFDVQPQIVNDRTMVPMRKIFETLGAEIEWIEQGGMIFATKGSKIIAMQIGKSIFSITDVLTGETVNVELDVAPMIVDSRTLVPLRAVSEALDMNVEWDGANRMAIITSK